MPDTFQIYTGPLAEDLETIAYKTLDKAFSLAISNGLQGAPERYQFLESEFNIGRANPTEELKKRYNVVYQVDEPIALREGLPNSPIMYQTLVSIQAVDTGKYLDDTQDQDTTDKTVFLNEIIDLLKFTRLWRISIDEQVGLNQLVYNYNIIKVVKVPGGSAAKFSQINQKSHFFTLYLTRIQK